MRGEPLYQEGEMGAPPNQHVIPAHSMQERGWWASDQEGEGGGTP